MPCDVKDVVLKEDSFDKLEIRLGRVLSAAEDNSAKTKSYVMRVDFGKFGIRVSVGRFTSHLSTDVVGALVLGVLNFKPKLVGNVMSEVLLLGVQFPKAKSGEATFITTAVPAKIGSKLF